MKRNTLVKKNFFSIFIRVELLLSLLFCHPITTFGQADSLCIQLWEKIVKSTKNAKSIEYKAIIKTKHLFSNGFSKEKWSCQVIKNDSTFSWIFLTSSKEVLIYENQMLTISNHDDQVVLKDRDSIGIELAKCPGYISFLCNPDENKRERKYLHSCLHDGKSHSVIFKYPDEEEVTNISTRIDLNAKKNEISRIVEKLEFSGDSQVEIKKLKKVNTIGKGFKKIRAKRIEKFISNCPSITIVDFWYMSCYPCHRMIKSLSENFVDIEKLGVSVLGINQLDNGRIRRQKVKKFWIRNSIPYTNYFGIKSLMKNLNIFEYPTLIIFDCFGSELYRVTGWNENIISDLIHYLNLYFNQNFYERIN